MRSKRLNQIVEEGENMCEKVCWTCGHFAFGCFVTGEYNNTVQVDDTCDKWVKEGMKGTVTDYEEIDDDASWADEYLRFEYKKYCDSTKTPLPMSSWLKLHESPIQD